MPQVAVFDTAFHQTMPPASFTYALPAELAASKGIRRYGFHGISYYYLVQQAAAMLQQPVEQTNLVACHLGAGSSVCAVKGGCSFDTSMGLTPLEGLCMATRCGDLDASVVGYLVEHCGLSGVAEVRVGGGRPYPALATQRVRLLKHVRTLGCRWTRC